MSTRVKSPRLAVHSAAIFLYAFLTAIFCLDAHAEAGDLDTSFQAPVLTNSPITLAIQPDGKILLPVERNKLMRLKPDGSRDSMFASADLPLANIYKLTYSLEGVWYVNGIASDNNNRGPTLVRLKHDGEVDASFQFELQPGEQIRAFVPVEDGGVVYFANVVDENHVSQGSYIRMLDRNGKVDQSFAPAEVDGDVRVLIRAGENRVLVGGSFTKLNGSEHPKLVFLNRDGTVDESFASSFVRALFPTTGCVDKSGRILLATMIEGRPSIVRVLPNGDVDLAFKNRFFDGPIENVAVQNDGQILASGQFRLVKGMYRCGIARFGPDGAFDPGFAINSTSPSVKISVPEGPIYALESEKGADVTRKTTLRRYLGGIRSAAAPWLGSPSPTLILQQHETLSVAGGNNRAQNGRFGNGPALPMKRHENGPVDFSTGPEDL
jgi:hypothetical protein